MSNLPVLPKFLPTPIKGVYAVQASFAPGRTGQVLGTVGLAPRNPAVWEARDLRNVIIAQRSTRHLAGLALIREVS